MATMFAEELPERIGLAQSDLFEIHPRQADEQGDGFAPPGQEYALVLRVLDTSLDVGPINHDDFHRISSHDANRPYRV